LRIEDALGAGAQRCGADQDKREYGASHVRSRLP
jgi:hypothetical protein